MKVRRLVPVLAVAHVLGMPAAAMADELRFDTAILEACLQDATAPASCIGAGAGACMVTIGGPAGAGMCFAAETDFWQARLEESVEALLAAASMTGRTTQGQAALRDAGPTFESYREAACAAAADLWPGMQSGPVWAECRMRVTAEHALRLSRWQEALQ